MTMQSRSSAGHGAVPLTDSAPQMLHAPGAPRSRGRGQRLRRASSQGPARSLLGPPRRSPGPGSSPGGRPPRRCPAPAVPRRPGPRPAARPPAHLAQRRPRSPRTRAHPRTPRTPRPQEGPALPPVSSQGRARPASALSRRRWPCSGTSYSSTA